MVTAGIATLPEREECLKDTIDSIYNQVDKIIIGLNNYKKIPDWLVKEKIQSYVLDNKTGDAAKFLRIDYVNGYYFSLDDDLIYPRNYVGETIKNIQKDIVSYHGRSFDKYPIHSYYKSASERYQCLHELKEQKIVQFGGTGVMAFHTDDFKVSYKNFSVANMADIWIGLFAKEQGIKIRVLSHKKGWIKYHPKMAGVRTIYDNINNRDNLQTYIINDFNRNFKRTEK